MAAAGYTAVLPLPDAAAPVVGDEAPSDPLRQRVLVSVVLTVPVVVLSMVPVLQFSK